MELRTHTRILSQAKWFIVLVTVFVGLAAMLFGLYRPVTYQGVVSFNVQFVNRPDTAEYQYGAYYDLKGAEIYSQDIMSWFRAPAFVEQIYQTAGVGYTIDSIARFTNRFQAKQYSARNFAIVYTDLNPDTAKLLGAAIAERVVERAQQEEEQNETVAFAVQALEPVVAESSFNVWLVTVVGLVAGLIMSIILVYLKEYFR